MLFEFDDVVLQKSWAIDVRWLDLKGGRNSPFSVCIEVKGDAMGFCTG